MTAHTRSIRALIITSLFVITACGGGSDSGGGPATAIDANPAPPPPNPLDPVNAELSRYYSTDHDFVFPYLDSWFVMNYSGDTTRVASITEPGNLDDPFHEYVMLSVAPAGTYVRDPDISNVVEISSQQYVVNGLTAQETIFDADLRGAQLLVRFLEVLVDVNDKTYAIVFAGARTRADGFDAHLELMRYAIKEMSFGSTAIDLEDGFLKPGRAAAAFDGERFLAAMCRDEDRARHLGRVVAATIDTGSQRVGREFTIDDDDVACERASPSITWDGTNFLVTYVRRVNAQVLYNGELQDNRQYMVVGKRVSQAGILLDANPILISQEGTHQESYIFKDKAALDPRSVFDGSRHVIVWEQLMNEDIWGTDGKRQIHGAFVSADGSVSQNFVVFDRLNGMFGYAWDWEPDIAVSANQAFVIVGLQSEPDTQFYYPRPIYGQMLDLSGVKLSADPILVRTDDGAEPRYPRVASDGTNFVVSWIQGEQATGNVGGGFYGVSAKVVYPDGSFAANVTAAEGVEIAPEVEENRDFLELEWDGSSYLAVWGVRGYYRNAGVWGTRFTADLSTVREAEPVWGAATGSGSARGPMPDYLALAVGNPFSVVLSTTGDEITGWLVEAGFP